MMCLCGVFVCASTCTHVCACVEGYGFAFIY